MIFNFMYNAGMIPETTPCQPRTLAQTGSVRVDLCGCGQVHVTVGPLTVRLAAAQYRVLCETLLAGARGLPDSGALH